MASGCQHDPSSRAPGRRGAPGRALAGPGHLECSTCPTRGPILHLQERLSSGCHHKMPCTGGLNYRNVSSHSCGGWKGQDQWASRSGAGESLFLVCRRLPSHCVLTRWGERDGLRPFFQDHQSYHIRAPLMTSVNLNYLLNTITLGVRVSHVNLRNDNLVRSRG